MMFTIENLEVDVILTSLNLKETSEDLEGIIRPNRSPRSRLDM